MLRIGADRADDHSLFDTGVSGRFDDIRAEQEIVEVEVGRCRHVGSDAADSGGQVEHDVGSGIGDRRGRRSRVAEIDIGSRRSDDVGDAAHGERPLHRTTEEARSARDEDSLGFERRTHREEIIVSHDRLRTCVPASLLSLNPAGTGCLVAPPLPQCARCMPCGHSIAMT